MASKDRIQRLKEENRINILDASLHIAKAEGWQALSMRKIADAIEYTAPTIYEYFANKEALLLELTRRGYLILLRDIREARGLHHSPAGQLEAMWFAYWDFAMANRELYQLMFGIEMNTCCDLTVLLPESGEPSAEFCQVIATVMRADDLSQEAICLKYYTLWAVVHGLVSIHILKRGNSDKINYRILKDAINAIISSMRYAA